MWSSGGLRQLFLRGCISGHRGAGEGEEHLIEGGLAHPEIVDLDPGHRRAPPRAAASAATPLRVGTAGAAGTLVDRRGRAGGGALENGDGLRELRALANDHLQLITADAAFEIGGSAVGDHSPVVDHDDVVGEALGLLEVTAW